MQYYSTQSSTKVGAACFLSAYWFWLALQNRSYSKLINLCYITFGTHKFQVLFKVQWQLICKRWVLLNCQCGGSFPSFLSYPIHSRFSSEVPDVRSNQIRSTDPYQIRHDKLLHSYPVHITLNTVYFLHLVYLPFRYISYAYFRLCLLIRSPVINFRLMFYF